MELICEACRATIQIPNERIPQNSTFRLTCPRCKRKIVASTKASESTGASTTSVSLTDSSSEAMLAANDSPDEGLPGVMDSLQPGQSAVLLCVNREEGRRDLKAMLEGMDYAVDMPAAADQALQRLRFNQYSVILLDDEFEGRSPKPLMAYLASLNMSHRREMFVVLVGERFKTADHLQAFVDSVDLVLHPHDISQLPTLLSKGLRDHERFYKVFNGCLIEAGKKL
jgi:CheY-like chemotaxis protein